MKHLTWIVAVVLLGACKSARPPEGTPIVELSQMSKGETMMKGPAIIKIPAGTRLPLDVSLDTPFVRSDGGKPALYLVYNETIYWYPPQPALISFDGENWEHGYEVYTGKLNVGVGQKSGAQPRANLSITLEKR